MPIENTDHLTSDIIPQNQTPAQANPELVNGVPITSLPLPKAHTGYPDHAFDAKGRYLGFKKGHKKLGGKKKGYKHFKTRFIEELENVAVNERGISVKNDVAIVKKAIQMAREGDIRAIEFIIERVDGKVPNVIAGSEEHPLQIVVESVISEKYGPQK